MSAEPGKIVGGKYRLEKPLAKGGMGSVWLAHHTELEAPVAVKFMAHELVGTPAAEARFKREAKAAAQLRSPHVVHIHDYGVEDGAPFMVMERLDGEDLAQQIAREEKLSVARVSTIVSQVAKALTMAHAAGIVHRDLKPSNLFLARSGDDEIVKVLDFGVAKETVPTLVVDKTTSGVLIGSPQYMSPEQARGEHVDFQSDLWSLGVVVYEALTGTPPFESAHLGALLAKIGEATPAPATRLRPDLPAEIDTFMARALARRPEDRFASAKALADALAEIAGKPGVSQTPATPARVVVPVATNAALARNTDTLPAGGPDPVSTTMHERRAAKELGTASKAPPKVLLLALAATAAAAVLYLVLRTDSSGEGVHHSASPNVSAANPEGPANGTAISVRPSAEVSPVNTAATVSTQTGGSTHAVGSTPVPVSTPAATETAKPKTTGSASAANAPSAKTAKPVATAAPKSTNTSPPGYDPTFGLPAGQ